jgi:Raf kinase inhibitor-like YbhB/YbcL family protein
VAGFEIASEAFEEGATIPSRHTCDGQNVSPPLSFGGAPAGTRSLALVVDDPDAPVGTFTHWLAWGIDASVDGLGEGQAAPHEGRNGFGTTGYAGPCPPHGRHRYSFRLHALDTELDLEPGADRDQLDRALEGHVVQTAELVGGYER